jgi:hypothetical protein
MALKVTRSTGTSFSTRRALSASRMCQEMASPSRSGSVARISLSAPFTAAAISDTRLDALGSTSQIIAKSWSGSTEPSLAGRSRMWPNEAMTS